MQVLLFEIFFRQPLRQHSNSFFLSTGTLLLDSSLNSLDYLTNKRIRYMVYILCLPESHKIVPEELPSHVNIYQI